MTISLGSATGYALPARPTSFTSGGSFCYSCCLGFGYIWMAQSGATEAGVRGFPVNGGSSIFSDFGPDASHFVAGLRASAKTIDACDSGSGSVGLTRINPADGSIFDRIPVGLCSDVCTDGSFDYVAGDGNLYKIDLSKTGSAAIVGTLAIAGSPFRVAISADGSKVAVNCKDGSTTVVVNAVTMAVLATLAVDGYPWGVAFDNVAQRIYIGCYSGNTLCVIDYSSAAPANWSVIARWPMQTNDAPHDVLVLRPTPAAAPAGILVVSPNNNLMRFMDSAAGALIASIGLGTDPAILALDPAWGVYNTNAISGTVTGTPIQNICTATAPAGNGGGGGGDGGQSDPVPTFAGNSSNGYSYVDRNLQITAGSTVTKVGLWSANAMSFSAKILKRDSAGVYDVVANKTGLSHPGGGFVDFALTTPYAVPSDGSSYFPGYYQGTAPPNLGDYNNAVAYGYASGDVTGTNISFTEHNSGGAVMRVS